MKCRFKVSIDKDLNSPINTFLLRWNPAISSYTMEQFDSDMEDYAHYEYWDDFNWSVHEWEKAQDGDRFFMLRVGEGKTGIFAAGHFISDPFKGEDWSGKGREVYYMTMEFDALFHPKRTEIITTEELQRALPNIDWEKGHSGELITTEDAECLNKMWNEHIKKHAEAFRPRAVMNTKYIE